MTTQAEFLETLHAAYAKSVPFGGNMGIARHIKRVEAMTSAEWAVHIAALKDGVRLVNNAVAANKMARAVVRKSTR